MLTIGHPFEFLSEVDSTNNYIADHPGLSDMAEGTAILAYEQTGGRGQRQRAWHMVKDKDLAVSYLFRPRLRPEYAFRFNKMVALALRQCISEELRMEARIKWPNDIYVAGQKVAGILIEPVWAGVQCKHVVVGIGVNVNSLSDRSEWLGVSMLQLDGRERELMHLFGALNQQLQRYYLRLGQRQDKALSQEYDSYLLGIGEELPVSGEGIYGVQLMLGVDALGRLVMRTAAGQEAYVHGAVTLDYSGIESE